MALSIALLVPGGVGAQDNRGLHAADSLLATLLPASIRASVSSSAPGLIARRAEVVAADARRAAVGFAPAAALAIETEDARNGRLDRGSTRVEVSREFLSGARRRSEREVADMDVRIARLALVAEERRTLAGAAGALYAAAGWRAVVRRLSAQDTLLASAEASVRSRFSVGEARYVDVLRLRTERLRVQTDRATAETESETAAIALVALVGGDSVALQAAITVIDSAEADATIGRPAGRIVPAVLALRLPEAPPIESLLGLAAELQLADARIAQTRAQRQLVLARQRPSYVAALGLQRIGPERDGSGAAFGPVLSAGMSLPFTAARANRAGLAAADQLTAAAIAARGAAAVSVRGALAAARARYEAARRRAATFDATLLQAAREERESALAAYRTSELSLLELLDFERALARAEIERTRATLDALAALTELLSGAPSPVAPSSLSTAQSEAGAAGNTDVQ